MLRPQETSPVAPAQDSLLSDPVADALRPVASQMRELSTRMASFIPVESKTSKEITAHVLGSGGKRIRPGLFLMACRLVGYDGPHLFPMAAVAELVHTASLLHDDVVDNSTLRRNKPTANSIWGDESSVLVGDLLYARASEMMADTGSLEIVSGYARAIRMMSEGELLQLEGLYNPKLPESAYMRVIECKTATLIATACRSAAVLAGAPKGVCDGLEQFGRLVGFAFQLLDDALDYAGETDQFGKIVLKDLAEGKVTLPLILLREDASPENQALIDRVVMDPKPGSRDFDKLASLIESSDAVERTIARAREYTTKATEALAVFPDSPARKDMLELGLRLVARFN